MPIIIDGVRKNVKVIILEKKVTRNSLWGENKNKLTQTRGYY